MTIAPIRQALRRWADSNPRPSSATAIVERFVADFGEEFLGSKRPHGIALGTPKECFVNAACLAMDRKTLEYVEGYAFPTSGIHFLHAWCVRGDRVIEPTLEKPEDYRYLGVRVPTKLLISILTKQEHYGLVTGIGWEEFIANWSKNHMPVSVQG